MRFDGEAVVVTGATGGIGEQVARRFAREGARVALHTYRRADEAEALAEALDGDGHAVVQADLMDEDGREALVETAADALDGLDVLVNNAGRFVEHDPAEITLTRWREAWTRTLALNLRAPADLSFLAAARMREAGGGAIVNVSSRGAFRGEPTAPAYGASKAGLNALTGSLAQRLGEHGIRVAAVAPGFVETPMVEAVLEGPRGEAVREESALGRVAQPEEIAAAVAFLASDECPVATGAILDANGASYLRG